jgi:hypothetical protein
MSASPRQRAFVIGCDAAIFFGEAGDSAFARLSD